MKHTTFEGQNTYEGRDAEVQAANGYERVTIGIRYHGEMTGLAASMTPNEARRLGEDLIARADEVLDCQAKIAQAEGALP